MDVGGVRSGLVFRMSSGIGIIAAYISLISIHIVSKKIEEIVLAK